MRFAPFLPSLVTTFALTASATAQSQVPFDGTVTEDNVQVLAGAGRTFYTVGEVQRGTPVHVDEMVHSWYKIVPPEGVASYVSKAFVDLKGDGRRGVVNENRTDVKAANIEGPGRSFSYRAQVLLNRGDEVKVLGAEGDFYKIEPPEGAYVFLPPGTVTRGRPVPPPPSVQRVGPELVESEPEPRGAVEPERVASVPERVPVPERVAPPERVEAEAPRRDEVEVIELTEVTYEPVAPPVEVVVPERVAPPERVEAVEAVEAVGVGAEVEAVGVERVEVELVEMGEASPRGVVEPERGVENVDDVEVVGVEDSSPPVVPIVSPARSDRVKAVEADMLPLLQRPLGNRPLDRIEAAYRELASDESLPESDAKLVELRLEQVRRSRVLAASLDDVARARRDLERSRGEAEQVAQDVRSRTPTRYDAVGRLMASDVYDGTTRPRMYRLIEPGSGRTLAYVDPARADTQVDGLLGQLIGVTGATAYDPATKLRVISVQQAVPLDAANLP